MKKTITIEKIQHRNEDRIKVVLPNGNDFRKKIKSITGRKWSATKSCWHVPYSKQAFAELKATFGELEIIGQPKIVDVPPQEKELTVKSSVNNSVTPPTYSQFERNGEWQKMVVGQQIICDCNESNWFILYIPFDKKGWINVVRNIHGRKWNAEEKYWQLPYVKESFRALKRQIGMKNLVFNFKINPDIPEEYTAPIQPQTQQKKQYKKSFYEQLNEAQKEAITLLVEKLTLARMSLATIKTYKHHLAGVLFYYKDFDPRDITVLNVQQYLLYQIRFKKIAESTQNQIISAVKAYWEKVLNRDKKYIQIPRPKKPKKLPNVLSTEEVVLLVNAIDNLKHRLIILLVYSAGLRRSEVLNLLKKDINIQRRAIHIKGGKGKKDRYVTLAETVIPYLEKYLKQYRPTRWLFEGQHGGKYSATSIQNIFSRALKKSRINPYATLHTLRHSYATHCMEQGHPLKHV
ncbi:MAG: tyrosine-type recombinase/integrase, partial [Bacteroidota bacterium]